MITFDSAHSSAYSFEHCCCCSQILWLNQIVEPRSLLVAPRTIRQQPINPRTIEGHTDKQETRWESPFQDVLLLYMRNTQFVHHVGLRNPDYADRYPAFTSHLSGAENLTYQCQNCGNLSARPMKRWEWFTFCFIPVIPFSLKPYKELGCHICNFWQDVKYRPDVQAQLNGGAPPQQQNYQMGGHEQGTGKPGYGPPPAGVPHQYQ